MIVTGMRQLLAEFCQHMDDVGEMSLQVSCVSLSNLRHQLSTQQSILQQTQMHHGKIYQHMGNHPPANTNALWEQSKVKHRCIMGSHPLANKCIVGTIHCNTLMHHGKSFISKHRCIMGSHLGETHRGMMGTTNCYTQMHCGESIH